MFETLDTNALQELTKLDDHSKSPASVPLVKITACLDMAAKECAAAYAMGHRTGSGGSYQVVEAGILAAQRIVARSFV